MQVIKILGVIGLLVGSWGIIMGFGLMNRPNGIGGDLFIGGSILFGFSLLSRALLVNRK